MLTAQSPLLTAKKGIMKRTLLLALGLLFAMIVSGQNNIYIINEDFSGNGIPESWEKSGVGTNNWYISNSFSAGGKANELQLSWSPQFNGIARFVSPAVDLTGINSAMFSLDIYVSMFSGKAKIGVASSSDNGSTWNTIWSEEYTKTEQHSIVGNIIGNDMGKKDVKFCFYFEGNSYAISGIYFDNFNVYTVDNTGIELSSIDVHNCIRQGENPISFSVKNTGESTIKSFEARCLINGEEALSESFYTDMNYLETKQFTFEDSYDFSFGEDYEVKIEIFRINDDNYDSDNSKLAKNIEIALGDTQRTPMIEHFSSSTCGPCVSVNYAMSLLTDSNKGKYTYTKYAMNWPGLGDPYFTEESDTKKSFYGVQSAPEVYLDGRLHGTTYIDNETFQNRCNVPAVANVRGAFNVTGNTINVIADFMTYFKAENINAYISVNEKTTTGNVGSNGETEFHHIMLKMLNDAEGKTMSINAGEYQRLEFSYDMSTTFMEDINDIEVSLWLQNNNTKEIYNSHYAYTYTEHCYPVRNLNVLANNQLTVKWDKPETGSPIGYNVYVDGELVAEKTASLEYSATSKNNRYVEVVAVYENDMTSVGVAKQIVAEENVNEIETNDINIYPNPANDRLHIETKAEIEEVVIYDVYGRQQSTVNGQQLLTIDLSILNTGIYFIKINTKEGNIVKRIIKQ